MAMNLLLLSALGGLAQSPGLARVCVRKRIRYPRGRQRRRPDVRGGWRGGWRAGEERPPSLPQSARRVGSRSRRPPAKRIFPPTDWAVPIERRDADHPRTGRGDDSDRPAGGSRPNAGESRRRRLESPTVRRAGVERRHRYAARACRIHRPRSPTRRPTRRPLAWRHSRPQARALGEGQLPWLDGLEGNEQGRRALTHQYMRDAA